MGLKNLFEKYEHHFEPGGKLENTMRYLKQFRLFLHAGYGNKRAFSCQGYY